MSVDLILIDIDWLQVAIYDSKTENSWHNAYSNQKLIDWMTSVSSSFWHINIRQDMDMTFKWLDETEKPQKVLSKKDIFSNERDFIKSSSTKLDCYNKTDNLTEQRFLDLA